MGFSYSDYLNMDARVRKRAVESSIDGVESERGLHLSIMKFCDSQWPRWKYIRSRMDKRSTIEVGAADFTIAMPGGKTIYVECKRKGEKLRPEQQAWRREMEMLQQKVFTVYSMADFMEAIK